MTGMNNNRLNSLVAVLDRIDEQIGESNALLLKLPTRGELLQITDELTYLRIQRQGVAAELENKH